jgi:hypothetical protein
MAPIYIMVSAVPEEGPPGGLNHPEELAALHRPHRETITLSCIIVNAFMQSIASG